MFAGRLDEGASNQRFAGRWTLVVLARLYGRGGGRLVVKAEQGQGGIGECPRGRGLMIPVSLGLSRDRRGVMSWGRANGLGEVVRASQVAIIRGSAHLHTGRTRIAIGDAQGAQAKGAQVSKLSGRLGADLSHWGSREGDEMCQGSGGQDLIGVVLARSGTGTDVKGGAGVGDEGQASLRLGGGYFADERQAGLM